MPLSYLLLLAVTGVIFYYKRVDIKALIKIPTFHILFSMLTLAIAVLPQALIYFDAMSGFSLLSQSRVEGNKFEITKDYKVDYKVKVEFKNATENEINGFKKILYAMIDPEGKKIFNSLNNS